jgi:hypothetical protein
MITFHCLFLFQITTLTISMSFRLEIDLQLRSRSLQQMYNPSQPNVYRAVRMQQERSRRRDKRARDAAAAEAEDNELRLKQQQQMSASLAATMMFGSEGSLLGGSNSMWDHDGDHDDVGNNNAVGFFQSALPPRPPPPSQLLVGGSQFDAETLVKERVALSAALGVTTAKAMLQDEEEVRHKERVQQGNDMSSRVGKLLGKLNALPSSATAGSPAALSFSDPQNLSGNGAQLPAATDSSASSKVGHLVFVPSTLGAGGHMMQRVSSTELSKKEKKIGGKPSSTLFVTLASRSDDHHSPQEVSSTVEIDQLLGPWVCRALQLEAASCGVIRSSRRWSSLDNASTEAGTGVGGNGASLESSRAVSSMPPRMFLRFDSVASSFKAAEKLDGRAFEEFCTANGLAMPAASSTQKAFQLRVAFYPTAQYDANTFDAVVA